MLMLRYWGGSTQDVEGLIAGDAFAFSENISDLADVTITRDPGHGVMTDSGSGGFGARD